MMERAFVQLIITDQIVNSQFVYMIVDIVSSACSSEIFYICFSIDLGSF